MTYNTGLRPGKYFWHVGFLSSGHRFYIAFRFEIVYFQLFFCSSLLAFKRYSIPARWCSDEWKFLMLSLR